MKISDKTKAVAYFALITLFISGVFLGQYELPPKFENLKSVTGRPQVLEAGSLKSSTKFEVNGLFFQYGNNSGKRKEVARFLRQQLPETTIHYARERSALGFLSRSNLAVWQVSQDDTPIRSFEQIKARQRTEALLGVGLGVAFFIVFLALLAGPDKPNKSSD